MQDKLTAFERAQKEWGTSCPDWVITLAKECGRTSQSKAAAKIGYSPTTVSQVIANKYRGNLDDVRIAAEGKLLNVSLTCPVLGKIDIQSCRDNQKRQPASLQNSQAVRVYRACHGDCPHSEVREE